MNKIILLVVLVAIVFAQDNIHTQNEHLVASFLLSLADLVS